MLSTSVTDVCASAAPAANSRENAAAKAAAGAGRNGRGREADPEEPEGAGRLKRPDRREKREEKVPAARRDGRLSARAGPFEVRACRSRERTARPMASSHARNGRDRGARLGARRSALGGARRSALGARRSALGARRSALGARRSALGARRSALGARHPLYHKDRFREPDFRHESKSPTYLPLEQACAAGRTSRPRRAGPKPTVSTPLSRESKARKILHNCRYQGPGNGAGRARVSARAGRPRPGPVAPRPPVAMRPAFCRPAGTASARRSPEGWRRRRAADPPPRRCVRRHRPRVHAASSHGVSDGSGEGAGRTGTAPGAAGGQAQASRHRQEWHPVKIAGIDLSGAQEIWRERRPIQAGRSIVGRLRTARPATGRPCSAPRFMRAQLPAMSPCRTDANPRRMRSLNLRGCHGAGFESGWRR